MTGLDRDGCEIPAGSDKAEWAKARGDLLGQERCTCGGDPVVLYRDGCAVHGSQPREHPTPCFHCHRPTMALGAICADCQDRYTRALTDGPGESARVGQRDAELGRPSRAHAATDPAEYEAAYNKAKARQEGDPE